jgi:hypothetical protein
MLGEDTKNLLAGLRDVFWTQLRLMLPWTRRTAMTRAIRTVAADHGCTDVQAFALMYHHASPAERVRLAPYRPVKETDDDDDW